MPMARPLPEGSRGAALAGLLGVPGSALAGVGGADQAQADLDTAVAELVASALTGTLRAAAAGAIGGVDPAHLTGLRADGPAPALRVGKQPFGVLPAIDLSRYAAGSGDVEAALAPVVSIAQHRARVPLDVDPGDRDPAFPSPRQVTATDDSTLPELLVEAAASVRWAGLAVTAAGVPTTSITPSGLDGLLGPADGAGSPGGYLPALAAGTADDPTRDAAGESLLGALAIAVSGMPDGPALLGRLAGALDAHGRDALAAALAGQLDVFSHRTDAWVTAVATGRRAAATTGPVLGAYGYATGLAPRQTPRTFGHIHAPSAAHAATAAVLRSGYLGQRRAAWAQQVADAIAAGDAAAEATARAGLNALTPLDSAAEATLPMAIDLTSTRVRRARRLLQSVRAGQPLGAALGRVVERSLVIAGLSAYLAPLRKLTRFAAGTALETLEQSRRDAQAALDAAEITLDGLLATEAGAQAAADAADAELAQAQAAYDALAGLFSPYAPLDAERPQVAAALAAAQATIADLNANAPAAGSHNHPVNVP